ncbi:MAG: branched-chain amino acid ABC transporter substrate-binding protein [Pseudomonadota bacterium]
MGGSTSTAMAQSASPASPGTGPLTIGVGAALSGGFSLFGEHIVKGVEAAVADLNAAGGVLGQNVRVVTADDECSSDDAVLAANRLIGAGSALIVGHLCYGASKDAAPIYADQGIIQITPATQSAGLTDDRAPETLFRLAPRDTAIAEEIADMVATQFAGGQIAIINDDSAYGTDFGSAIGVALAARGIQPAFTRNFTGGQSGYRRLAGELVDNRTDAVIVGAYYQDVSTLLGNLREAGSGAVVIAGETIAIPAFAGLAGPLAERTVFAATDTLSSSVAAQAALAAADVPDTVAARYFLASHAAVMAWASAVETTGGFDPDALATTLRGEPHQTVIGPLRFSPSGDAMLDQVGLSTWRGGRKVPYPVD